MLKNKDTSRNGLHAAETDWEAAERKIIAHRKRKRRITAVVIIICAAAAAAFNIYASSKSYTGYNVSESSERTDSDAIKITVFNGNILKYSNEGASCTNAENETIWNQAYDMESPMVSICSDYAAIADYEGRDIYILNSEGLQGTVSVTMPILKAEVSSKGTVAILMEEDDVSYLALYDKDAELLAEGAIYADNTGTPMDIALSYDADKLAVSVMDVSGGSAATTIIFYDFSSAGQKQVDNITAQFTYEDTVIPDIEFFSNDVLAAFGDGGVYLYSAGSSPEQKDFIAADDEIISVFYDDKYFGTASSGEEGVGRFIEIYDTDGNAVCEISTDILYSSIGFLENHEICLYDDNECAIFKNNGNLKFTYEFEDEIKGIAHIFGYRKYAFLMDGRTDIVNLKLFDIEEEEVTSE